MEAKAKYDFQGTQSDELNMSKGDIIKILDISEADWYQAEKNGKIGIVPATYVQMEPHDWFMGKISRQAAEPILLEKDKSGRHRYEDGAFLVRKSESDTTGFSLSVKHGNSVQHFKILNNSAGSYYLWAKQFRSITELVKNHKKESVSRSPNTILLLKEMSQCETSRVITAKALYEFTANSDEELSFRKGDKLIIKDQSDPDWFQAELNGRTGFVPSNYLKIEQ